MNPHIPSHFLFLNVAINSVEAPKEQTLTDTDSDKGVPDGHWQWQGVPNGQINQPLMQQTLRACVY